MNVNRTTQGHEALDEEKHGRTETQHDCTPRRHDSRLRLLRAGIKIQSRWGECTHELKPSLLDYYYLIISSCLWKSGAQADHVLEAEDAWREVEEEDQVHPWLLFDTVRPANRVTPHLCPAVNTHPQLALSQQLTFDFPFSPSSLLLMPLFICFDFFTPGLSRVLFPLSRSQISCGLFFFFFFTIPGCSSSPNET